MKCCSMREFSSLRERGGDIESLAEALGARRVRWRGISLVELGGTASRFEVDCEPFVRDGDGWRASRWVGRFSLDGKGYAIKPRIGWPRLEAMLEGALSVGVLDGGSVRRDLNSEGDLAPLAWVLAHESAWQRHRGPVKAFVRVEEKQAPVLRGELDLGAQLVKLTDRHTIACRYDEITYDHPVNRGTMLALRTLQRHGRFPFNGESPFRRTGRQWQEALAASGVRVPEHFPGGPMRWSRANDGFQAAHALAEVVVGEREASTAGGTGPSAFLFDTAEIWEFYLHRQFQEVVAQYPGYAVQWPRGRKGPPEALLEWAGRAVCEKIPDIQVRTPDGNVAAVIDAKCRQFLPLSQDPEVAQQMFLYAARAQRDETEQWPPAVLIYPACEGLNARYADEGPRLLGEGRFLAPGGSGISAWAIALPSAEGDVSQFHQSVKRQLAGILEAILFGENAARERLGSCLEM